MCSTELPPLSRARACGAANPVVPAENPPLGEPERERQQDTEQAEDEHAAPHLRNLEAALELNDRVTQSVRGAEQFADDHHDDADRQRLAGADHDLWARRTQYERPQPQPAAHLVAAAGVDEHL